MNRANQLKRTGKPSNVCGDYGYTNKRGTPCGFWVTPGTQACKFHAGKPLPEHRQIGLIAKTAAIALNQWGLLPADYVDPTETFLSLIALSARRVAMYADLLQAIQFRGIANDVSWRPEGDPGTEPEDHEEHAMRVGLSPGQLALYKTLIGNVYTMSKSGQLFITNEAHRALITLDGEERDRLGKLCYQASQLGIEERRVKIAEEQGGKIAAVVRRMLDEMSLSDEQMALAGPAFRAALAAVFNEGNILEGVPE
jgi:hypothetical protein